MGPGEASQRPGPEPGTHSQRVRESGCRRSQLARITAGALRPSGTPPAGGGGVGTARQPEGGRETPRQKRQHSKFRHTFKGTIFPEATPTRSQGRPRGRVPGHSPRSGFLVFFPAVGCGDLALCPSRCYLEAIVTSFSQRAGPQRDPPCSGTSVEKTRRAGRERRARPGPWLCLYL